MDLNLPIFDHVADCEAFLIAGIGGGFDVFCGEAVTLWNFHKTGARPLLESYRSLVSRLSLKPGATHLNLEGFRKFFVPQSC
jgi:hypothetical protein